MAKLKSINPPTISVLDAIKNRRSIRDFQDKTIDRTTILSLIDHAIKAPSAMHKDSRKRQVR